METHDYWQVLDEFSGELNEEEGEFLPSGYQAADGLYKPYCSCHDFVVCGFCKCFQRVKECLLHGKAVRRQFKPCSCPSSRRQQFQGVFQADSLVIFKSEKSSDNVDPTASQLNGSCKCPQVHPAPWKCDCSSFLGGEITVKPRRSAERKANDTEEAIDRIYLKENEIWQYDEEEKLSDKSEMESEGTHEDLVDRNETFEEKQETVKSTSPRTTEAKCCTCKSFHSRSGSSSELETDSEESRSSSSFEGLDLGDELADEEGYSDLTISEDSSTNGRGFDPTRVKWISYASDRSVESLSDEELDEDDVDKLAADWGIRNIYGNEENSIFKRTVEVTETKSQGTIRQYLMVQQNQRLKYAKNMKCLDGKAKSKPYIYKLLEM